MAVKDGSGPRRAKRHFLNRLETRLCLPTFILHSSGPRTPSQGQNTMAVKDGSGPRSAKRHFLNRLETSSKPHPAQLRAKDPFAGPKHHGSDPNGQAAACVYTNTCPSCQQCVQSSVFTGKVNTRGHCGRQFRVAAGRVCTRYTHACPTCNTKVESKQPHGRIRAQHTNTRGRTCKTTEWLVAAPNEPCRSSRKVAVGSQRRFRSPGATAYRRFLSPLEK